jgi:glycosyltransferase involved in cell wall biosynthesis
MGVRSTRPRLSIVVVVFDMGREAPRTLRSLSPAYQQIDPDRYELIVVDNGSPEPLTEAHLAAAGRDTRYVRIEPAAASPSPAAAVNIGAAIATGEILGIIVDGARMASPGLIDAALQASQLGPDVVVTTMAWHLGPDAHSRSRTAGYDQNVEDRLLDEIDWPRDGYRLFDVATIAPASARGPLFALPESSALFLPHATFDALGGFDERFDQPAGGLVASDFFRRLMQRPAQTPVVLVGEATFHQIHGSGNSYDDDAIHQHYERLRGEPFHTPDYVPILVGRPPPAAARLLAQSAVMLARAGGRAVTPTNPEDDTTTAPGAAPDPPCNPTPSGRERTYDQS